MSEWIAVSKMQDLAPGTVRKVQAGDRTLALACSTEGIFAVENSCPHEGGSLGEGSIEGSTITCPLHSYKFDGKSGGCLTEKRYRARVFETKIEQGQIWVRAQADEKKDEAKKEDESAVDPALKKSAVEIWKTAKHGLDAWPDILRFAQEATPMSKIEIADLERMKWYGFFYRKNNDMDHYMCRIRIPGCEMTSAQAQAMAFIAYESGYSLADVTTRGNIQIQGLTVEKLPGVRAALEKVGLTAQQSGHDNVRNVTSHPYSGLDPEELSDTRALSLQMQAAIVGSREFSDLPRKFNVAISGRSDPAAHAWTQDISFVAALGPDGQVGYQLLLGGSQGQAPKMAVQSPVFVRSEQVVDVLVAALRTYRELGWRHNRHQVRFHFLIERIGSWQVLTEMEKRLGYALERFDRPLQRPLAEENFIGWFKQKQEDLWALGVCVPLGRLTWDQLEGLAVIAQQYGWGTLRTTLDQNIVIPGIASVDKSSVAYAVARYGLTFEPDPVTRNVVSCTGKQFCNLAVTETKGYAYQLIETLRRRNVQLHGIGIHVSGCPSSCGMTFTADIGLKGVKIRRGLRVLDAFDVYLGGGIAEVVQMGILYKKQIPVKELPDVIEKVVQEFYVKRNKNETFSAYWTRNLKGLEAKESKEEIARWSCARCGHLHVAQTPPAFCPLCAALRGQFEPAMEDAVAPAAASIAAKQSIAPAVPPASGKKILIIGGSIAGHTAAETARALDPLASITIVTDEKHRFYNRLNLTRYLAQEVQREELFDYSDAWYKEHRVEAISDSMVIGLDPIKKEALLAEGRTIPYDACILAHGSSANIPKFHRPDLAGVTLLRTLEDADGILASIKEGMLVVMVGGGVLGLEAAYGMAKRGAKVSIVEYMPMLMPRQLDSASAAIFAAMVREKSLECHLGVGVKELIGQSRVESVLLTDGRCLEAQLVVISTGIQPNIDWVKRSGIYCERGVVVDDRMQTSSDGIFACGDVAQWHGEVIGLWSNAIEQAKVAAANAAGKMAFFQGFLPVTILKCLGIPLASIGHIQEDGGNVSSRTSFDASQRMYRRVILKDGIPVGAILLGTSTGIGDLRKLVEQGIELQKLKQKILPEAVLAAI